MSPELQAEWAESRPESQASHLSEAIGRHWGAYRRLASALPLRPHCPPPATLEVTRLPPPLYVRKDRLAGAIIVNRDALLYRFRIAVSLDGFSG